MPKKKIKQMEKNKINKNEMRIENWFSFKLIFIHKKSMRGLKRKVELIPSQTKAK